MDLDALLKTPRSDLKEVVMGAVRSHVQSLKNEKVDLYGYAIHLGVPYEFNSLVAVWNSESDVAEDSSYYRLCVDEWAHWDHDVLASATPIIAAYNAQFESLHVSDKNSFTLDDDEVAHIAAFHSTILDALRGL